MCGWRSCLRTSASRVNRATAASLPISPSAITFRATGIAVFASLQNFARYTVPMTPVPISDSTSNGPMRSPNCMTHLVPGTGPRPGCRAGRARPVLLLYYPGPRPPQPPTCHMPDPLLVAAKLTKDYGSFRALDDLNLSLAPG